MTAFLWNPGAVGITGFLIAATPPPNPQQGFTWVKTDPPNPPELFLWDGFNWIPAVAGGGGLPFGQSGVYVSPSFPANPQVGNIWVNTSNPAAPTLNIYDSVNGWVRLRGLPPGTSQGQLLVTGASPAFDWQVENGIIEGTF